MLLKNEELKQISYATTLLEVIKQFAWEEDADNLLEKTGITIIDLEKSIKALKQIHTKQKLYKLKNSEQSTLYKKTHKRHRNIMQNINYAKHKNNQKKLDYWTQKLKEEKGGE
jgi:hypothetical protein